MKRSLQLRQQRAKLVADANALIPAEGRMSQEVNQKFDAIMADVDAMKTEIDRIERAEALQAEMEAGLDPSTRGANPGSYNADADATQAEARQASYKRAFDSYLRRGVSRMKPEDVNILRSAGMSTEYRDQDNLTGGLGGYTVPQGFQRELEVALKYFGGMRNAARVITTDTGNQMPWPTTNDTSVVGVRLGGNALTTAAVEADQNFNRVIFNAWTYSSNVFKVPNELLQDSAFDLEAEIRDRIAERIGRIQNTEFTTYAGANGPVGVVGQTALGKTGAAGQVTSMIYDDIIDLIHSVDPLYRPMSNFMMHDTTLAVIRKIKDNYGRPLFGPGLNGEEPDTLAGYKFVINNDWPVMAANAKSVGFGAFKKYIIRDVRNSTVVVRLNELYALNNEVGFVAFTRSDAGLVDAGTHPIKYYANPAA